MDREATVQRQARAMGDPTRYKLFRAIADAGEPVSIAALVEHLGLHHTAVRQHLAVLRDAGLIIESSEHSARRGRPRFVYRASVEGATRWSGPEPYEQLSLMLLQLVHEGRTPREIGEEAGRRTAARVAREGDVLVAVVRELARLGFDPLAEHHDDETEVVMRHCPMALAATRSPEIVCELHRGILEGMAAVIGGAEVTSFVPSDPNAGRCHVTVTSRRV